MRNEVEEILKKLVERLDYDLYKDMFVYDQEDHPGGNKEEDQDDRNELKDDCVDILQDGIEKLQKKLRMQQMHRKRQIKKPKK